MAARLRFLDLIRSGYPLCFPYTTGLEKKRERTKEHVTSQWVQTWKRQKEVAARLTDESTESG